MSRCQLLLDFDFLCSWSLNLYWKKNQKKTKGLLTLMSQYYNIHIFIRYFQYHIKIILHNNQEVENMDNIGLFKCPMEPTA